MNREERDRIILENLPLVGYLVSDISSRMRYHSRDDLASVGTLALITCAEAYDATVGVPFGAYARRRILGAFADEMRSGDWATRTRRRRIKETTAARETLTGTLGRNPTVDEIASVMGIDRDTAAAALSDSSRTVSVLDETTAEFLVAGTGSPEDAVLAAEQLQYIRAAVDALPEKMRYIIRQVYLEERSVKDIAEELGSTHSAISQQRSEGIRMLQQALSAHYGAMAGSASSDNRRNSARHSAYLISVKERTFGGITRGSRP